MAKNLAEGNLILFFSQRRTAKALHLLVTTLRSNAYSCFVPSCLRGEKVQQKLCTATLINASCLRVFVAKKYSKSFARQRLLILRAFVS
jgi:hypothetical protein